MNDKYKIREMKLDGGEWHVKFEIVHSIADFGAPAVRVPAEEFRGPEIGMHQLTIPEVEQRAHRDVANALHFLFKTAVKSIPNVEWERVKSLTVSEILSELGIDDK